jgi:hypothetical protein
MEHLDEYPIYGLQLWGQMIPCRLGKDPHGQTQCNLDLLVQVQHAQSKRLGDLPHQIRVPPPPPLPLRISSWSMVQESYRASVHVDMHLSCGMLSAAVNWHNRNGCSTGR